MDLCNVHTLLRLPTGIFYAQGIRTNVVFLTRGITDRANTKVVWVYDMRANMPAFGKTRPLTATDFRPFEHAYGAEPAGSARRIDEGETGRFRAFTREAVRNRADNLDIAWLRDETADPEEALTDPDDILAAIAGHLRSAMEQVESLDEEIQVGTGEAA